MAWQQGEGQSQDRWPELIKALIHPIWHHAEGYKAVGDGLRQQLFGRGGLDWTRLFFVLLLEYQSVGGCIACWVSVTGKWVVVLWKYIFITAFFFFLPIVDSFYLNLFCFQSVPHPMEWVVRMWANRCVVFSFLLGLTSISRKKTLRPFTFSIKCMARGFVYLTYFKINFLLSSSVDQLNK